MQNEFEFTKTEKVNTDLLDRVKNIYRKISSAAIRSGRSPFDVKLVAVTKTVSHERIQQAIDLGLRSFGENRIQEAKEKIPALRDYCPSCETEWHLIGHLQRNKVKTAVELFDMIHTIDSVRLAEEVNRQAEKHAKVQRVLIQVKLSEEETKHGVEEKELMGLLKTAEACGNLRVEGLMTMPPFFDNPELAIPFFRNLSKLKKRAEDAGHILPELSMGMTNDYEFAILEGATMVRIGTAIFGERRY